MIRDTASYRRLRPPWRQHCLPSLKLLVKHWLHEDLHSGVHDSVDDAKAALRLYKMHQLDWELCSGNRVVPVFEGATPIGKCILPAKPPPNFWPFCQLSAMLPPSIDSQQIQSECG